MIKQELEAVHFLGQPFYKILNHLKKKRKKEKLLIKVKREVKAVKNNVDKEINLLNI